MNFWWCILIYTGKSRKWSSFWSKFVPVPEDWYSRDLRSFACSVARGGKQFWKWQLNLGRRNEKHRSEFLNNGPWRKPLKTIPENPLLCPSRLSDIVNLMLRNSARASFLYSLSHKRVYFPKRESKKKRANEIEVKNLMFLSS